MGHPKGAKNAMTPPKEKETLILERRKTGPGTKPFAAEKGISRHSARRWVPHMDRAESSPCACEPSMKASMK